MSSPNEPAGTVRTVPRRQLPTRHRRAAVAGAILLLAGGVLGALGTPGVLGLVGYGVCAIVAAVVGRTLHVAARRDRGCPSPQTTSLAAGLFALVAVLDVVMIVVAVGMGEPATNLDLRLGVLLVTALLALPVGAMGIFGAPRGQRSRERGEATPAREAEVVEDAKHRAGEHRHGARARARRAQGHS